MLTLMMMMMMMMVMMMVRVPLLFMELAVGQYTRRGPIGTDNGHY